LAGWGQALDELSPADVERLVHELRVHQIELELQNDELRRAQGELQASRDRYFDLYDLAPVGYFTLSWEGLILEANLTGAAMLGVEIGRLLNKKPLSHFIIRDDQATFLLRHQAAFETGARQTCELGMVQEDDGAPFYARLECTVTKDSDGNAQGRVAISDVSERVRAQEVLKEYAGRLEEMVAERTQELLDAQEQLVRREKLATLGQLAGGVAHELRNPLGAIGQAAYFLNMVLPEPDTEVRQVLGIMEREVKRSVEIIHSLLDFGRTAPPVRWEVDVNDIVQAALSRAAVPEVGFLAAPPRGVRLCCGRRGGAVESCDGGRLCGAVPAPSSRKCAGLPRQALV
ncbi:MAG: PAS domain S-box protein, partial [Delftia sp.]|nr:PAS domain S-box protein [Delftia sp.]